MTITFIGTLNTPGMNTSGHHLQDDGENCARFTPQNDHCPG